ncbi:MAG: Fur family transcriptional regulator [Acetanaerobacterium sp.]
MNDEILTRLGIKATRQRRAIIDIIVAADTPLSADEIYARIPEHSGVNYSTVYRTLGTLAEKGVLLKVGGVGGKIFYLLKNHTHKHHLVCSECQKLLEISECPIESLSRQIAQTTGFVITGHCLELTGICPDCAKRLLKEREKQT